MILVCAVLGAGFVGGMVSQALFSSPALGQISHIYRSPKKDESQPRPGTELARLKLDGGKFTDVLIVRELRLVDSKGRIRARFHVPEHPTQKKYYLPRISIYDWTGRRVRTIPDK